MSDFPDSSKADLFAAITGEALMRLIADSVPALIAYYDVGTLRCRFANRRYAEYNGWTPQSMLGKTVREAIGEPAWKVIAPYVDQVIAGQAVKYRREQTLPDGGKRMIEVNLLPHFDDSGAQQGSFVLINDITDQWRAEVATRESEERMRKFAQASNEGIVFHANGLITDGNEAVERMLGFSVAEVVGRPVLGFIPEAWKHAVFENIRSGVEQPYEAAVRHRNGQEIPVEIVGKTMPFGDQTYRLAVVRDITAHKEAQARIEFMALHDALTRLPNRLYLKERLGSLLAQARRNRRSLAVLFIDLDNFKTVNDSLGHHVGDLLLVEVADRLSAAVRQADIVARLGGDEFVVVLAEVASPEDASRVAAKLIETVNGAVAIEGRKLSVSPSIGISVFPGDGDSADDLIRHADAAMYHAKDSGRSNYQFFTPNMSARAFEVLNQEGLLREAIRKNQFVLHFQPQLRIADGQLMGMEALVRWQHPGRGLVGPDDFIRFAEARGLIAAIGRWVLAEACRQLKQWHDAGYVRVPVAINLSAIEFKQRDLVQAIAGALQATGLDPRYLEIELTESALLDPGKDVLEALAELKALGIGLAVDDFGTGYSSLAYLKRYPIDRLKIDRSFVRDILEDADDTAIVTAIIQMAHSLKLTTVAEGVETREQLALLQRLGCVEFQGYLVSRPVGAGEFETLLRDCGQNGRWKAYQRLLTQDSGDP